MLVRLVQDMNAPPPILVTLLGIVMLVRLVQDMNAPPPILVTLLGIVMLVTEAPKLKIEVPPMPTTFLTGSSPNVLGIVTAPVAVEPVIDTPSSSTM
jgi:hypothetical protein